ncbi:MAG: aminoglycoside phosphotransferase family protein [Pseudomonadota bacterium]
MAMAMAMVDWHEAVLTDRCRRWRLTDPVPVADTPSSRVYRVSQADGEAAVLKLLKPIRWQDERDGGALLSWYDGQGAARAIDYDREAHLIEHLPGRPLSALVAEGYDAAATEALCEIVANLHAVRGAPPALNSLAVWLPWLAQHSGDPLFRRLAGLAESLIGSTERAIPLHADLHHDNVLRGPRGWCAIDPKGMIGCPAFDLSNSFKNPVGAPELVADLSRTERMAHRFAERLGYPRARILGWAAVYAGLSASWDLEDGDDPSWSLAAAVRALSALDRIGAA